MRIAIHDAKNSFSEYWIPFCKSENIPFKIVNCYDNKIIENLRDCDALMWHYHHNDYKDVLFAKQLLFSLEQTGKKVFPDFNTAWYFDDKIGQKYLLESLNVPLVPSYVFYDRKSALEWIENNHFPKVFKLRGGAGSANVKLVKTKNEAVKKVNMAFGRGFVQFDRREYFFDSLKKYREGKIKLINMLKASGRLLINTTYAKMKGREKGYVYFQDFVPNNKYDIRIIVIGDKAFCIKRMVRQNDFRASGSGTILYEKKYFDNRTLQVAFSVAEELNTQCCAFDFVYNENNEPLIVEVSYGFSSIGYKPCVGYWNKKLDFFEEAVTPHKWMVENIVNSLNKKTD